jgi:hypothetical protein
MNLNNVKMSIELTLAYRYFQEALAICNRDKSRLWGNSLYGPMLLVDPKTRMIVANQSDQEGNLVKKGEVFVGWLPEEENIANTATIWAGVKWTMIVWPLPENRYERAQLMVHELFHRIQDKLGLWWPSTESISNAHLDSLEGRIWLQLEWRALSSALTRHGVERRRIVEDALIFRSYRRELFPEAELEEHLLEMLEGLAEYTGIKLRGSTSPETVEYLLKRLEDAKNWPTFVRSFFYLSGPLYGILLDETGADWRKDLKSEDDLGLLLQKSLSIQLPENLKDEAEKRSKNYECDALWAPETQREKNRRNRMAEYRARLVEGPVLILPLTGRVNYAFDTSNLLPLEGHGTVCPTLRMTAAWGILNVSKGALMTREDRGTSKVHVRAPADLNLRPLQGDGWTLELNTGWKVEPGERKGDYLLKKEES